MNEAKSNPLTTTAIEPTPPETGPGGYGRLLAAVLTLGAGLMAGLIRLVPHPPNFSSVGSLGLFGGARLRSWHAFALPIGIMGATDLLLWLGTGFNHLYAPWQPYHLFVYAGFLGYVVLGRTLTRTESVWRIGAVVVLGSLQFFIITNCATWVLQPTVPDADLLGTPRYSRDLAGLGHCLLAALPFYQGASPFDLYGFCVGDIPSFGLFGTLLGDLLFTGVLFGVYGWLARTASAKEGLQLPPTAPAADGFT